MELGGVLRDPDDLLCFCFQKNVRTPLLVDTSPGIYILSEPGIDRIFPLENCLD
jgi:hypothetical protein